MGSNAAASAHEPIRLAVWYGKGGVGKSTTTMMLSLMAARRGHRVLTIDLDPECGTSRDFLGPALRQNPRNVRAFLDSPTLEPPAVIPSGIGKLDILPCSPDEQRFFRHFPEHSTKLRDGLTLAGDYRWIIMDTPNQFDNIAELGLIAADYVLLPVELTADCVERVGTALRIIAEAKAMNPTLTVIGALALASAPRCGQPLGLTAKERLVHDEYRSALAADDIPLFKTVMFRSATTVEEARSNADDRLLHWTARRRFKSLFAEITSRIKMARSLSLSPNPYAGQRHVEPHAVAA